MSEAKPTSIQSSSQKGMRAHHPNLSRSRRDTPSYSRSRIRFGCGEKSAA
jgi:hypothetical protein